MTSKTWDAQKRRESERFDQWWRTQDWDGAYMDVAWDAWWQAVRDSTDEEIIEVLAPVSTRERDELRSENERLKVEKPDWWALIQENERLRAFLTAIEAGFNFHRLSAAEMASEARAALDGALEPLG